MRRPSLARISIGIAMFSALALACGLFVYSVVTDATLRPEVTYRAVFRDVSGLRVGSSVEVAGVNVGKVSGLDLGRDNNVDVEFTLDRKVPIATTSIAAVRYRDLLGRRVLEIQPGESSGKKLPEGGTIPATLTHSALDLDQLYDGFGPLFEGLDAAQLNELSGSLVQVLQGQGGNLEGILAHAAQLSESVAERDETIGALIADLQAVLTTIEKRTPQTDRLVIALQRLVSGLSDDRRALLDAIAGIAGSTTELTQFVAELRPSIKADLAEIERLSRVVNADAANLDRLLERVPGYYALVGRAGIYQSAFQFYLCGVQVRVQTDDGAISTTPMTISQERRCQH